MPRETTEQVFEALLRDWRDDETNIIEEQYGEPRVSEAHREADREMQAWRERFRRAVDH